MGKRKIGPSPRSYNCLATSLANMMRMNYIFSCFPKAMEKERKDVFLAKDPRKKPNLSPINKIVGYNLDTSTHPITFMCRIVLS